jgi:cytochrome d ubiquinol oxidase subunit II
MNSTAPIRAGNETWLVFGARRVAIIIPAVNFPILVMLLALVFRGRLRIPRQTPGLRRFCDRAFVYGSGVATFAQGVVLGNLHPGFQGGGAALRRHVVRLGDTMLRWASLGANP